MYKASQLNELKVESSNLVDMFKKNWNVILLRHI